MKKLVLAGTSVVALVSGALADNQCLINNEASSLILRCADYGIVSQKSCKAIANQVVASYASDFAFITGNKMQQQYKQDLINNCMTTCIQIRSGAVSLEEVSLTAAQYLNKYCGF